MKISESQTDQFAALHILCGGKLNYYWQTDWFRNPSVFILKKIVTNHSAEIPKKFKDNIINLVHI